MRLRGCAQPSPLTPHPEQRAAADKLNPVQLRLRLGDEVLRLRLLLLPLVELEKKTRSMSLTMDELHTLRDKPDLEEDIVKLEAASRCVCVCGGGGRCTHSGTSRTWRRTL